MLLLCFAGAFLNIVFNRIFTYPGVGLPLYLDTILTITITFMGGLFWGMLTGALTNVIVHTIYFWGWEAYLFALCNIATALITWLFIRTFPQDLNFAKSKKNLAVKTFHNSQHLNTVVLRIIILVLLSFVLCFAMSILGGSIAAFIHILNSSSADELHFRAWFGFTMFPHLPLIWVEILSRIPVNIIDRFISVFAGYGIAVVLNRFVVSYNIRLP